MKGAINSLIFERTGLSTEKKFVLNRNRNEDNLVPEDVFRKPYMLKFFGLEEMASYTETDLEQAIIDHLQKFLLKIGRGFCFEA